MHIFHWIFCLEFWREMEVVSTSRISKFCWINIKSNHWKYNKDYTHLLLCIDFHYIGFKINRNPFLLSRQKMLQFCFLLFAPFLILFLGVKIFCTLESSLMISKWGVSIERKKMFMKYICNMFYFLLRLNNHQILILFNSRKQHKYVNDI